MEVIDPGYRYKLGELDGNSVFSTLQFVKRDNPTEKYPGNTTAYPGTTIQEVSKVLIDRVKYLDNREPHEVNPEIIKKFREVIYLLEKRNADKKGISFDIPGRDIFIENPENIETCNTCGHWFCEEHE